MNLKWKIVVWIGYWTGLFNHKDGFTTINFTEDVTPKRLI